MYLVGISVRRVEDITEALWGTRVSPLTVSDLNKKIYATIETWRNQPTVGASSREQAHALHCGNSAAYSVPTDFDPQDTRFPKCIVPFPHGPQASRESLDNLLSWMMRHTDHKEVVPGQAQLECLDERACRELRRDQHVAENANALSSLQGYVFDLNPSTHVWLIRHYVFRHSKRTGT